VLIFYYISFLTSWPRPILDNNPTTFLLSNYSLSSPKMYRAPPRTSFKCSLMSVSLPLHPFRSTYLLIYHSQGRITRDASLLGLPVDDRERGLPGLERLGRLGLFDAVLVFLAHRTEVG